MPDDEGVFDSEMSQEADEEVKTVADITINSMVGAFKLVEKVGGNEVTFLVDTEATHNFIDPTAVERIGLKLDTLRPFNVIVVDGEKLFGNAGCLNTKMITQRHATNTNLLVVPLGDPQVILGLYG